MRIILIFLLFAPLLGMGTTIKCSNAAYANKTLKFYRFDDPVSGEKTLVFTLSFDANGNTTAQVKNKTTVYTFSDFGIYRGMLMLEPGQTVDLKLPPFREKSFGDEKNPYFSPATFWFHTENKKSFNDKLSSFYQQLNSLTNKFFDELYFNQSKTVFDSVNTVLNEAFPEVQPKAFLYHKNLRMQFVKADIFRQRPEQFSAIFNDIETEFWTHEAFMALFDKTFTGQLSFSAKAIGGKEIFVAVQKQDTKALLDFIEKKYKVSGEMADLVLLKLLHDGFYSNDFSQANIKSMVSSPMFSKHTNAQIKKAAKNISHKFTFLEQGSKAPEICLNDISGNKQCSNNSPGKFKYIVFADVETVVCQEHLKYLSRIEELFGQHLSIFVVLRDTPKEGMEQFYTEHQIAGINTIDTDNGYSNLYKVRSFPGCYLLNEDHAVQFTNTKAPLDGFEQQFGTFLRNELFMRQREQYKKKK